MATHSYIFNLEDWIVEAERSIREAIAEYKGEQLINDTPKKGYPENKEVWGNLLCKVALLSKACFDLIDALVYEGEFARTSYGKFVETELIDKIVNEYFD